MKEMVGLLAVALAFLQDIPYVRDILRGKTKPHLYTYLIWSIVTVIAFLGQWSSGGGPGAWTTGVMGILTIINFLLCFKFGTEDITGLDSIFLAGALFSIIPWFLTHDPTLSVVLATAIDVLAFFPTIRKTYNDPSSETLISWISNLFRHGISIVALSSYSLVTLVFPATLLIMNAIVVSVIITRRKAISRL